MINKIVTSIGYGRVSQQVQSETGYKSLEKSLQAFADDRGFTYEATFFDVAMMAVPTPDRPQFSAMIDLLKTERHRTEFVVLVRDPYVLGPTFVEQGDAARAIAEVGARLDSPSFDDIPSGDLRAAGLIT